MIWGQADGNNPALCPALHNRKSHRGKCPNVLTPALPRHCRDNQKVIALDSLAFPCLSPKVAWIQMTGALWVGLHLIIFILQFYMLRAYSFTMLQGCGGRSPIMVGTDFKQRPVKCSCPSFVHRVLPAVLYKLAVFWHFFGRLRNNVSHRDHSKYGCLQSVCGRSNL